MTYAVLEGVSFALAQGAYALHDSGLVPDEINLIGGGARSPYWRQLLADVLNKPLTFRESGEVGPALGAARLAQLAMNPDKPLSALCPPPPVVSQHQPDATRHAVLSQRYQRFIALYQAVSPLF